MVEPAATWTRKKGPLEPVREPRSFRKSFQHPQPGRARWDLLGELLRCAYGLGVGAWPVAPQGREPFAAVRGEREGASRTGVGVAGGHAGYWFRGSASPLL